MTRAARRDEGQASIELVTLTPLVLLVSALVVQLALAGYCLVATENAARVGARAASLCGNAQAAAESAPPRWLQGNVSAQRFGAAGVEVRTRIPVLFSSVALPVTITRRADFPETC